MARFAVFMLVALCVAVAVRAAPTAEEMTQIKGLGVNIVKALLNQGANTGLAAGGSNPTAIGRIAGSKAVQAKSKKNPPPPSVRYQTNSFDFSALGIARFDVYGLGPSSINITVGGAAFVSGAFAIPTSIPESLWGTDLATYLEVGADAASLIGFRNKGGDKDGDALGAWAGAYALTLSTISPAISPALEPADSPAAVARAVSGLDVQATLGAIGTIGRVPKSVGPEKVKLSYDKSGPAFYLYAQLDGPAVLANLLNGTKPGLGFICGRLFSGTFSTPRLSNLPSTLASALVTPATTSYVGGVKQPLALSPLAPDTLRLPASFGFEDIPFGDCDGTLGGGK